MTSHLAKLIALGAAALSLLALKSSAFLPDQPFSELDEWSVFVASFEDGLEGIDRDGSNLVKNTFTTTDDGAFGTKALKISATEAGAAIYRVPQGFDPMVGTLEMWAGEPSPNTRTKTLFSLSGTRTLNDDGRPELVVGAEDNGSGQPCSGRIFFANEFGLFDFETPALFPSTTLRGVSSGDVDGDGQCDLVTSMYDADQVQIFTGPWQPNARLGSAKIRLPVNQPQGHTLVDFDSDGDLDIVVASFDDQSPPVFGFENDGAGNFAQLDWGFDSFPMLPGAEATAMGDVDMDGDLDCLIGFFSKYPSALLYGDLDANNEYSLNPLHAFALPSKVLGVSLADLDADGWLDIALARPGGQSNNTRNGEVLVYYNRGDGTFNSAADKVVASPGAFVVTATRDLDNDGHLDLAVASFKNSVSRIHMGPDFSRTQFYKVEEAVSLSIGDANGDGLNDVFFRAHSGYSSQLFHLDENGSQRLSQSLQTRGTVVGMGSHFASNGTNPYGSSFQRNNSIRLFHEGTELHFEIVDHAGMEHRVSVPYPGPDGDMELGLNFVRAEWDASRGAMRLSLGDPSDTANVKKLDEAPFEVQSVSPVFRLGSDENNQRRASNWRIDEVRLSNVLRSEHVCQPDLGLDGPGELRLSTCGEYLRPGTRSEFLLESNLPRKFAFLLVANHFDPMYVRSVNADLLGAPLLGIARFKTNSVGEFRHPIRGGIFGGVPTEVYIQALAVDGSLPKGIAVSNALELRFQAQ